MHILIDYLTFTDKKIKLNEWKEKLRLFDVNFVAGNGRYGWKNHDYYSGLHVYTPEYNDRDDICIEMSGIGCRFLESLHDNKFDWKSLLTNIVDSGGHISRLDVACDDRDEDKLLSMPIMTKHCKKKKYISRARRFIWVDGAEQEILIGSSQSDTRLRIYNKALERKVDEHWIRAEFQLRNEAALSFVLNMKNQGDIGSTYTGVLLNYLRFTTKVPDDNNNNLRIPTTSWWRKFVQASERIKNIKVGGLEYNYSTLEQYIEKQCASSLKTYITLNDGDVTGLFELIEKAKLNIKQETLINNKELLQDGNYDNS